MTIVDELHGENNFHFRFLAKFVINCNLATPTILTKHIKQKQLQLQLQSFA